MTKIMITGATGLLGRALVNILKDKFDVIATGFSRATPPIYSLDLQNFDAVSAFIEQHQPDVIIHAAAERNPDACESDHQATINLNVNVSKHLANCCLTHNMRFFLISTDYVFDGNNAPYIESDETCPLNFYGQSKASAEQAVIENSQCHTVIRVPVLYGEVEYLAESAVTVIAQQLLDKKQSAHDDWAIRYPTHVEDIALTLNDLIRVDKAKTTGIFHVTADKAFTKYQMAVTIAEHLKLNDRLLTPLEQPTQTASRPYNCALKDTRLATLGINHQRDFAAAIKAITLKHL